MIENKYKQLNQRLSDLQELSKMAPEALEHLLDQLLESLNVETKAAVENANRVLELTTLNKIGQALSSAASSDQDSILKLVYEQVSSLMETRNFFVALYDKNTDTVSFPLAIEGGKAKKPKKEWASRKTGRGLTEYVIRHREPLFIPANVDQWYLEHQDEVDRIGQTPMSWLGVPIIVRDEVVGVIAAQDYEKERTYDHHDLRVLSTIASQAAIAITNARLFQRTQRQANEALQLRKVSQTITSSMESSKVLSLVAEGAREVIRADLIVLHPMSKGLFEPAVIAGEALVSHRFDPLPRGEGITSKVMEHGLLVVNDLKNQPEFGSDFAKKEKIRSFAGIALKVGGEILDGEIIGGELLGVLYANFRHPHQFGESERNALHVFANQAAIAIKNARLFSEVKLDLDRRIQEFHAIERIDHAITTEGLDAVLERILEVSLEITKAPNGNVMLVDGSGDYLEVRAIRGQPWVEDVRTKFKIGQHGVSGWVASNKRTALIPDVKADEWREIYIKALSDTVSEIAVPLLDEKDHLLGVINLESPSKNAFLDSDQRLLEAFARQGSIAIQNQRRYQNEFRTREELEVLSGIDKAISSTLELEDVLQMILDKGLEHLGDSQGNIMLFDKVKGDLWMAVGHGETDEHRKARQRIDQGIVGLAVKEKRSIRVSDVTDPEWKDHYLPFIPDMRSELAVPLIQGDRLIGVINVENSRVGHFSAIDEQFLENLGEHAVIAIQNAKQYEQLKILREIDKAIIAAKAADQILDFILDKSLQLIGAEIGELRLVDPTSGELILRASKIPQGIQVDSTWTRIPPAKGISAWCIEHRQSVLIDNVELDDRYIAYFKGMKSELAVPFLVGDAAIGVINLESPQIAAFDNQDQKMLETLAGQALITIQMSEAYNKAESESKRFRLLHHAGQELGQVVDIQQLDKAYDLVIQTAQEQTQSNQAVIRRFNEATQELRVVCFSLSEGIPPYENIGVDEGLSGQVAREQRTIVVDDIANPPAGVSVKPSDPTVKSLLITPVRFKDHYYGNLGLSHKSIGHFKDADVELLEGLTRELAVTIHRLEATNAQKIAEKRAIEAETMSTIGQSGFELAHRLGNELGLVKSYRNKIADELTALNVASSTIDGLLDRIVGDVNLVLDLSKQLKSQLVDFRDANAISTEKAVINVADFLRFAADSYRGIPENIQVRFDIGSNLRPVFAHPDQVADTLRNLFANAVEAMPNGGTITLRARNIGNSVETQVVDTGVGIEPDKLGRIFDLFYSTKGSYGFGLWSARHNALANGGDLQVISQPGRGTTFIMLLPVKM